MTKSGALKIVGLIVIVLLVAAAYVLWPMITQQGRAPRGRDWSHIQ